MKRFNEGDPSWFWVGKGKGVKMFTIMVQLTLECVAYTKLDAT